MPSVSVDTWEQLVNPGDTLLKILSRSSDTALPSSEALHFLKRVTLFNEHQTGALDGIDRFDEKAIEWEYQKPVVNEWLQQFLPASTSKGFKVVFSHDVDWITTREPLSILKSLVMKRWGNQRSWVSFSEAIDNKLLLANLERILSLEQNYGVGAFYFMLAGPYDLRRFGSRYDAKWSNARRSMDLIQNYGGSVGLHGSFNASKRNSYASEAAHLSEFLGSPIRHHRNHYLRFDSQRLWSDLENAGISYDFSVGYVNHMGFRAGVVTPFWGYDWSDHKISKVKEIPLIFMDRFPYLADKEGSFDQLKAILNQVKQYDGCVSILFHPEMYLLDQGCFDFYERLIQLCLEMGADVSGKLS